MAPQDVTAGLLGTEKANGSESGGFAMARYRIAPEQMIMELPDDLSYEHAAAGNCTLGAVLHGVRGDRGAGRWPRRAVP